MPAHHVNDPLISLSIRIRQSLLDVLKTQAIETNVTLADQFRAHLSFAAVKPLGVPVKRKRVVLQINRAQCADPVLLRNLAAIGSNLNQLARAVNSGAIKGEQQQAIELLVVMCAIERDIAALVALSTASKNAH
jgi:hypothetical protein